MLVPWGSFSHSVCCQCFCFSNYLELQAGSSYEVFYYGRKWTVRVRNNNSSLYEKTHTTFHALYCITCEESQKNACTNTHITKKHTKILKDNALHFYLLTVDNNESRIILNNKRKFTVEPQQFVNHKVCILSSK